MVKAKQSPRISCRQEDTIDGKMRLRTNLRNQWSLAGFGAISFFLFVVLAGTVSFLHSSQVALITPSEASVRPRIPFNEFYVKGSKMSDREVDQFFGLQIDETPLPLSSSSAMHLQKISLNETKLIVPHLPRSGTSVILSMLRVYSQARNISMGTVVHCWDVSASSLMHAAWSNGRGSYGEGRDCALFRGADSEPLAMTTSELKNKLQIMVGQLSYLGKTEDVGDTIPPIHYIFLMREPRYRVLSEIIHHRLRIDVGNRKSDPKQMADLCVNFIRRELSLDRYSGVALMSSLITPNQKEFVHTHKLRWTHKRRTFLAKKNMRLSNGTIMFGSMDHFNTTLDVLSYAIPEIPYSLVSYVQTGMFHPPSPSIIWSAMNSEERTLVQTYTMWEQQVYDLAMEYHRAQAEFVKG